MIGLDTNVLARYFVRDDPQQTSRADRIIESELSSSTPGYISVVVLVELTWVLERSYKLSPQQIADVLYALISNEVFVIQNDLQVHIAYMALRQSQGSFADALIAALNALAGCRRTLTFDRKALLLPGFELIA